MTDRRVVQGLAVGAALGFTLLATAFFVSELRSPSSPERVSEAFFLDTYTHEFSSAWEWVSAPDKVARGKDEYLADNPLPNALQAAIYDQLAEWGEFQVLAVASSDPTKAVVSAHIRFPNSAHSSIEELVAAAAQPSADRVKLLEDLAQLFASGELQYVEGDISFDLVLEDDEWRIKQRWGQPVTVHFEAAVSPDLPWEFYPVQTQIQAQLGELVKAPYIARNNSDTTITAKAIHEVGPPGAVPYFLTVECFCFTEQTLEPGEEREMALLFQIDISAPRELESIGNRYTFYTLDEFPSGG